jgi:26S proteasome regulatory subunit N8
LTALAGTTVSTFVPSLSVFLSSTILSVVVHPLVLLSVADHHARSISRNSHKRVIGVLLGQDNGKTINVANSFGIPFEEDEKDSKTWFLDHNYIEGMYEMFKKVNGESPSKSDAAQSDRRLLCSPGTDDRVVSHRP